MMEQLKSYGMNCEILSVAKKHYDDMLLCVMEERLSGPRLPLLIDELLELRIVKKDKVDHPRKGSKDLSDAVCGSIYNSIIGTPRTAKDVEIEIHTYKQFVRDNIVNQTQPESDNPKHLIVVPQSNENHDRYFGSIGMI